MPVQKTVDHCTLQVDYTVRITADDELDIQVHEKYGLCYWKASFTVNSISQITSKTGNEVIFDDFVAVLVKAIEKRDISCFIDILSSQDLQNLKAKKNNQVPNKQNSKSNKRYLILTYMVNDNKYHYPLSLSVNNYDHQIDDIKKLYDRLRLDLETARTAALNDTAKTENQYSIQYDKKTSGKYQTQNKEVDQLKSENEILKAKLLRLEEQAQKNKTNIEIQAAIERAKQFKQCIETANLQLVDWKNNVTDQEETQYDLKKEVTRLHKKICGLLVTDKEVTAKKKGQEVEKELNQVKLVMKKNNNEVDKLKKELENSKNRVRQLELKVKKLNSEKDVIRRGGRRGPYSSAGSIRSYGSYNTNSSKKSYGVASISSKGRSNYSYNSRNLR